jgi:hypothetical protein
MPRGIGEPDDPDPATVSVRHPRARGRGISHRRQNTGVPISRISWLVTVGVCLVAALLLLLNGYFGYSGVLLAVGAAAAVNLL